jgi:uncharacterized RDD family membrane protein YckC
MSSAEDLTALGLDELVTGEAVALELRPASFAPRALAIALDVLVEFVVLFTLALALGISTQLDEAAQAAVYQVLIIGVFVGMPVAVETLTRGRSLGKLAAGLRVVRDDGGPVRWRQALVRGLLGFVEIIMLFGSVALIASLSNRRGKRLGDLLAGTYVIRERTTAPAPAGAVMPPHLAGWATSADFGRAPDRLALATRQFLHRRWSMHPPSRGRLGAQLAASWLPYVSPPPPDRTPPEDFLLAVLAERGRRDLLRLSREQAVRAQRDASRRAASPLSSAGTALIGETLIGETLIGDAPT